jgi:hypothetical protein
VKQNMKLRHPTLQKFLVPSVGCFVDAEKQAMRNKIVELRAAGERTMKPVVVLSEDSEHHGKPYAVTMGDVKKVLKVGASRHQ